MEYERRLLRTGMLATSIALCGCAAYRVDSNVPDRVGPVPIEASTREVILAEGDLPNRRYVPLGPIEVSVKKLTIFHPNPTKEKANDALVERARQMGADAVVNITYDFGVGWTTWGYMDAKGTAVRFVR